jgi:Fic family protein
LKETKVVLESITIGGKSLREHFEVINHKEAIDYVEAIVSGLEVLDEWQIKAIQQLVLKNIDSKNADAYRQENGVIAGAEHSPQKSLNGWREESLSFCGLRYMIAHFVELLGRFFNIYVSV